MRMRYWLVNIHRRLWFSRGFRIRKERRSHQRSVASSALIERLESRLLLTAAAVNLFESKVNTYSAGIQSTPSVAMDAAGDSVVTWVSELQDGSGDGVFAQRYDSSGKAIGNEFQVNTYTQDNQNSPVIAMDAGQDGSGFGIYAKRYNASGVVQGSEFQINTYTTNDQMFPAIAMNSTGSFIIAWTSSRTVTGRAFTRSDSTPAPLLKGTNSESTRPRRAPRMILRSRSMLPGSLL